VPVSVCRAFGARYVIAVYLNADICGRGTVTPHIAAGLHESPHAPPSQIDGKNGRAALKLLQRQLFGKGEDVPGISTIMFEAFNIVQDRIARSRLAGDPPDVMISPRLAGIGPFEFHRADELIERGAAAAYREVEDIARELEVRRAFEARTDPSS
jgi:NTE family protein